MNFAEFLYQKNTPKAALRSIRGLCGDLAMDITEARQEMWVNFPRDIV